MDDRTLELTYRENLEERLIARIADMKDIPLERAMDAYYRSRLAEKIHEGLEGVQYLDYKVLAQILTQTEPGLFA